MVVPKICRNGGAEHARGIHSRTGERSSKENIESDCRSDDQPDNAPRAAFINGGAVNDKHEKERIPSTKIPCHGARLLASWGVPVMTTSRPNRPRQIKAAEIPPRHCAIQ